MKEKVENERVIFKNFKTVNFPGFVSIYTTKYILVKEKVNFN